MLLVRQVSGYKKVLIIAVLVVIWAAFVVLISTLDLSQTIRNIPHIIQRN